MRKDEIGSGKKYQILAHDAAAVRKVYLRSGNSSMTLNMIITYAQMVRSYYIQQLIEKVIGSTNQILKNVHRVLSLKDAQGRKIIKKSSQDTYGKNIKKRSDKIVYLSLEKSYIKKEKKK